MEKVKQYIEERKKHLKKCEIEYFEKAHDRQYTTGERIIYREFSNAFEARRNELEILEREILSE